MKSSITILIFIQNIFNFACNSETSIEERRRQASIINDFAWRNQGAKNKVNLNSTFSALFKLEALKSFQSSLSRLKQLGIFFHYFKSTYKSYYQQSYNLILVFISELLIFLNKASSVGKLL